MKYSNKLIPSVLIIGAGGIGCRHLQSFSKIEFPLKIFIVDNDTSALKMTEKMFKKSKPDKNLIYSNFIMNYDQIPKNVDIAIIATCADVRKKVFTDLVQNIKVKYVIFEKVAFQSEDDFKEVVRIVNDLNIKSWVNCTRRMYPFYKELKNTLSPEKKIEIKFYGSNWGLGCNSIHFLDLFAFLTGQQKISVDFSRLDKKTYPAKRDNVVEFGGELRAKSARNDLLTIIDNKTSNENFRKIISSKNFHYKILHSEGKVISKSREGGWEKINSSFYCPYQSELTNILVMDILNSEHCDLTPIEESFEIHKSMLRAFREHLNGITGKNFTKIPIT